MQPLCLFAPKGTTGFEAHIDKCLELAEYLYNKIKNREGFEMVLDGKVGVFTVTLNHLESLRTSITDRLVSKEIHFQLLLTNRSDVGWKSTVEIVWKNE